MIARRLSLSGIVLTLILPGCVVEKRDFDALRDQVRLQQKQINDLKARQEEQGLRVDTLNNGFKSSSTRSRRAPGDEIQERGAGRAPPARHAPAAEACRPGPRLPTAPAAAEAPIL
jgi:hypothetical protein